VPVFLIHCRTLLIHHQGHLTSSGKQDSLVLEDQILQTSLCFILCCRPVVGFYLSFLWLLQGTQFSRDMHNIHVWTSQKQCLRRWTIVYNLNSPPLVTI
jgi:hypothetical protein